MIAVTATDIDDKLFAGANRGNHIAVAAPGVDVLVPAPGERLPVHHRHLGRGRRCQRDRGADTRAQSKLTPADIRRILTATARGLAPGDRDDNFGAGLIDPLKALQLADRRSSS